MNFRRKDFPILAHHTYLNTARSGLMYEPLLEWRQEHDLDFLIQGSGYREFCEEFIEEVRSTVGVFFGCENTRVGLVPNFSFAFNTFLDRIEGLKKVLLVQNDYPSLNNAVLARNFEVGYAANNENLEKNIAEAIDRDKPDILALSLVQYRDGIKIDLDFLRQLKADNPNLLIFVDATQFCGTQVFDFDSSGIDFMGASGYKWLSAGYGNGFALFSDKAMQLFETGPFSFLEKRNSMVFYMEPGHMDTFNYGSLKFSLEFLQKIGQEAIEEKNRFLSDMVRAKLGKLGLLKPGVVQRENHSAIFSIPGGEKMHSHLQDNNIISTLWGEQVRISFHFYNSEEDVDRLFSFLS